MKKAKIVIASLLTLISLQGFSSDKNNTVSSRVDLRLVKHEDQLVYRLMYQSAIQGLVKVSIYDASGALMLTERIQNQTGFIRPYNFSALPVGEYTIEVSDGSEKTTRQIFHGISSLNESNDNQVKVSVQSLGDNQKYALSVLGECRSVEVKIYDAYNNLVFTELVAEPGNFRKVYDFSKIKLQNFTFVVENATSILHSASF
jgi:hypothetical protein